MTDTPIYVLITAVALLMVVVYFHREIRDALGLTANGNIWIWFGLHFTTQWEWINSTPADANSIHWWPGQPNANGNHECGVFYSYSADTNDLLTTDLTCTHTTYSICEYQC